MELKLRPILLFTTTGIFAAILGYALASNTANHDGHNSHKVNLTSLPAQSNQDNQLLQLLKRSLRYWKKIQKRISHK